MLCRRRRPPFDPWYPRVASPPVSRWSIEVREAREWRVGQATAREPQGRDDRAASAARDRIRRGPRRPNAGPAAQPERSAQAAGCPRCQRRPRRSPRGCAVLGAALLAPAIDPRQLVVGRRDAATLPRPLVPRLTCTRPTFARRTAARVAASAVVADRGTARQRAGDALEPDQSRRRHLAYP